MDAEWYHAQDHYHHPHQHAQPHMSPVTELVVSAGFSFAPHTVPVAQDAFAGTCTSPFSLPAQSIHLFLSRPIHFGTMLAAARPRRTVRGAQSAMSSWHYFARNPT
jgi:hypothetical protein